MNISNRLKKLEQQTGVNEEPVRIVFISCEFKPEGDKEAIIDKMIADYESEHPAETTYFINENGQLDNSLLNRALARINKDDMRG
jgi:hypothetical protein